VIQGEESESHNFSLPKPEPRQNDAASQHWLKLTPDVNYIPFLDPKCHLEKVNSTLKTETQYLSRISPSESSFSFQKTYFYKRDLPD
jgi:hypothetical protein